MVKLPKELMKSLNLTNAQANVYVAALELGQASMQELARKSGVKRTSIYNFIEELKDRHLITEAKKHKRSVYTATHPERLIELEQERLKELNGLLPELMAIQNSSPTKPKVTFHEGIEAIKEVYADFVHEGKPIIAWSEFNESRAATGTLFDDQAEKRAKQNIPVRWITTDSPEAREFAKKDTRLLRETKFVKSELFKTKIVIYGNKVALLSYRGNPPLAVLVEDRDIADTLRGAWEELWNRL